MLTVNQPPPPDDHDPQDQLDHDTPYGAIAVTAFLAITIIVLWFGMYFLNLQRS